MNPILIALWPLFFLILAGYYMKRARFPNEEFWPGAERINYFFLFPTLLFSSLSTAPLDSPAMGRAVLAVLLTILICSLGMLAAQGLKRWPASKFGVLSQGVIRFNTYLGIAAAGGLFGQEGILFAAVVIAVLVPTVNVLSVLALSAGQHSSFRALLVPVIKNPLILACAAGVAVNFLGVEFAYGVDQLMHILASTSLPLGLMTVGAALRPDQLQGQAGTMIKNSFVRLLIVPAVAWSVASLLALPPIEAAILVLFFSLPTAPSAYVLTRQLAGDAHLMAGIITTQTLFSAVSLSLIMVVIT